MGERTTTDEVSEWINNDGDYYEVAKEYSMAGDLESLKDFCLGIIRSADSHSGPGYIAYTNSGYELDRVDWAEVARDLVGDDDDELDPETRETLGYE